MRKILSFVAAFLFAASMMADPVVLPAVLDVSNVSFRSEGMPDFVIPEGQDYAGTYFDMGAHDSSNDTLLYAEWDVTIQPIKYNLAVDVYNTNGWRVQLYLLNQAGDTVKDLRYKGSSEQKGQFSIGSLDLRDLAAGNYKLRARAATAWSAMKLKDIIFAADYQGVSVALPDTLLPAYALLSNGASVTNNAIAFAPSTANTEYATWNVSFAAAGTFNVTIDITASNGHNYGVALLSADGQTEIGAVNEGGQKGDTGIKTLGTIAVPAAGNYVVKLTNAIQWSEAVLNNIVFTVAIPEYYLVGSMNNWTPAEAYKFAANTAAAGEYMLDATLAVGDSIKVMKVLGNTQTWFPDGMDNHYTVDAAHAGAKTIYFQEAYKADWAAFGGYFYIEANPAPQPNAPYTLMFNYYDNTGSDKSAVETKLSGLFDAASMAYIDTTAASTLTNVYLGRKYKDDISGDSVYSNVKFGTKSAAGTLKFALKDMNVDSVIFRAAKYSDSEGGDGFTVNGTALTLSRGNKKFENVKYVPTAAITALELVQAKASQGRFYLTSITVYPKSGDTPEPQPEVHYYMKNNWNAAADWTWKEMTKAENVYKLDSVVFGGTGVNVDVEEATGDAKFWFPIEKISGATIAAKDTVSFVFNPADTTVAATMVGKYVEPAPEPMANPIDTVKFFMMNDSWSKDTLSTVAWDAENQKVVINNIPAKNGQWRAQLWLKLPMQVKAGKEYDLSFKATANKSFGGITVKYQENAEMTYMTDFAITAGQVSIYSKENLPGVANGNGILCIDFGFAPDSTLIELSEIAIVEHEPTVAPAKFYVTGNDAFTVDAGKTTADSWNVKAFKSEADTIVFNLKAGAEYQIKLSVDGTWGTAKGYNDLTEKAAGLIDADGNNHNIGFSLAADGPVKVIYTAEVFKLEGNFYVAPTLATCDSVYKMVKNAEVALNPVTVTYLNGANVYVKDATAGMLIYLPKGATVDWVAGDVLSNVAGVVDIYNGLYELKPDTNAVKAITKVAGQAPAPEVLNAIQPTDVSKYIKISGIEVTADTVIAASSKTSLNVLFNGDTIVLYNSFKVAQAYEVGKKYDIVGIVSIYKGTLQVCPITVEEQQIIGGAEYYLAGSMNGWAANADYKFVANPAKEGEYMLTTALAVNDEFKVIGVVGATTTWYPDGMGNNYKVDADHAGEAKTIYFRPEGGQQGWYAGYFYLEGNPLTIPTNAPAAPTAAEADVMAIYCNHYTTNNLNFAISGWAGAYQTLDIDSTMIGYWAGMTWECIIDPAPNTDNAHDFSAYKKFHVDLWAPKAAKIKITVEAVAGGNYKEGVKVDLVQGWNSFDFNVAEWPEGYEFKNVKCFVFEQYQTPAEESFEGNPFAFANLYFYDKESQGLDNTADGVKAQKYIHNGMILIEKGGKVYTITGLQVK